MSNPARRRGRGGNPQQQSDTTPSARGGLAPGAYDGPASRGGASSQPSSGGQHPSNPPSVISGGGSQSGSPVVSPRLAQAASFAPAPAPPSSAGGTAIPLTDPARDPARQARLTDSLRNVDLPASFYNMDNLVCCSLEVLVLSSRTIILPVFTLLHCQTFPSPLSSPFSIADCLA
jgi:hypothetical protein